MAHEENKAYPVRGAHDEPGRPVSLTGIELDTYRVYRQFEQGGEGESGGGGGDFSLRDILYVLFRHKKKIAFIFLFTAVASFVVVAGLPVEYESVAKVMIAGERMATAVSPDGELEAVGFRTSSGQIRGEIAIMQSADVARAVVEELGARRILVPGASSNAGAEPQAQNRPQPNALQKAFMNVAAKVRRGIWQIKEELNLNLPDDVPMERFAVGAVQGNLEIKESMGGSPVLLVRYRSHTPEVARDVLDAVLAKYRLKHIQVHSPDISKEFFTERAATLKAELEQKEAQYEQLKKQYDISELPVQKEILFSQLGDLQASHLTAETEIKALDARIASIDRRIAELPEEEDAGPIQSTGDPIVDQIMKRINELKLRKIELAQRYKPGTRPLQEIDEQLAELEAMLAGSGTGEAGGEQARRMGPREMELRTRRDQAVMEQEAFRARRDVLSEEIARLKAEIDALTQQEKELNRLQRAIALLEDQYMKYESTLQEAQISDALNEQKVSNVRVVQSASLPIMPARSPKKVLAVLFFGIFMGLAGGLAVAFGLEYFDHSLKTNEEIEKRLGLPVLVSLPKTKRHQPTAREESVA